MKLMVKPLKTKMDCVIRISFQASFLVLSFLSLSAGAKADTVCWPSGIHFWDSGNSGYPPNTTVKDTGNWKCYWNGYSGNNYNRGEPLYGNGWKANDYCPPNDVCKAVSGPTPAPTALPTVPPTPTPAPAVPPSPLPTVGIKVVFLPNMSALISTAQFHSVYTALGIWAQPESSLYTSLVSNISQAGIQTVPEWAALLANVMQESGGFQYVREIACQNNPGSCANSYGGYGPSGQVYFGRGFMQLSWQANYHAASQAIYGNDKLVTNPDLVASDLSANWGTVYYYWKSVVHNKFDANDFAASVRAINSPIECQGQNADETQNRYNNYKKIMSIVSPGTRVYCSCPRVQ